MIFFLTTIISTTDFQIKIFFSAQLKNVPKTKTLTKDWTIHSTIVEWILQSFVYRTVSFIPYKKENNPCDLDLIWDILVFPWKVMA